MLNQVIFTSSKYDRKFRYTNSFLINTRSLKSFKILKIYYYTISGQGRVMFHGLEGKVAKKRIIHFKCIGQSSLVNLDDIKDYQLAFMVRDKTCVLVPNYNELFL